MLEVQTILRVILLTHRVPMGEGKNKVEVLFFGCFVFWKFYVLEVIFFGSSIFLEVLFFGSFIYFNLNWSTL